MFGGLAVTTPVVVLLVGVVLAVLSRRRNAPSRDLPVPVVVARAQDARSAATGYVVALGVVVFLVVAGFGGGSPVLVLAAPLVGAAVHAAIAYLHEATRPRPTGRVRSALVVTRSIRDSAPPVLTGISIVAAVVVVAACAGGIAVAGPTADEYVWNAWNGSATGGVFPGGGIAFPVLVAMVVAMGLTAAVLHSVPVRPAVEDSPRWVDEGLRRTSAHRVVRFTSAALVGTAGTLALCWSHFVSVWGVTFSTSQDPADHTADLVGPLTGLVQPLALGGLLVILAGLVILIVPARGLRAPTRSAATAG